MFNDRILQASNDLIEAIGAGRPRAPLRPVPMQAPGATPSPPAGALGATRMMPTMPPKPLIGGALAQGMGAMTTSRGAPFQVTSVQQPKQFAKGGLAVKGAWTRKEGQNPEGGLNAKGRASLKAQGHDIKPPVSAKQAKKSPKAAARRKSFCARMGGMEGPMKDEKGRPTRKALALRKWDC